MPGKTTNQDPNSCKRCGNLNATITARQDRFCVECYTRFITTKIIKRMESFRVRNATESNNSNPRRLLLALSLGVSSLVLLHVLDAQIERQRARTGQAGFELCVCWVDEDEESEVAEDRRVLREKKRRRWDLTREKYPRHQFIQTSITDTQHEHNHTTQTDNLPTSPSPPNATPSTQPLNLSTLLPTLPSPSSRADLTHIRLLRTLTTTASSQSCSAILFGHTTTTLAQKILAETAKGRGFALPWLVNDGPSPYFGLEFRYPMRDLFKGEVDIFAGVVGLLGGEFAGGDRGGGQEAVEGKGKVRKGDVTIDGLMAEYFKSVEVNYPSIVANVMKTAGKLSVQGSDVDGMECGLCGIPVPEGRFGIHGWGGYDEQVGDGGEEKEKLCYGCARSLVGAVTAPV